eukprot:scaffold20592_cov64-Phaeocystis_antarctica.AAC.1
MLPSCAGDRCTRVQGGASGDVGARAEQCVCEEEEGVSIGMRKHSKRSRTGEESTQGVRVQGG